MPYDIVWKVTFVVVGISRSDVVHGMRKVNEFNQHFLGSSKYACALAHTCCLLLQMMPLLIGNSEIIVVEIVTSGLTRYWIINGI
jgi:hypothetical protein